jgi:fibronectin type 3 domain-containing protein
LALKYSSEALRLKMQLTLNILIALTLLIASACNNPKGGSVVKGSHTPFLEAPGGFSFSRINATDTEVVLRWGKSSRAASYTVFWGTSAGTLDQTTCTGTATSCTITGLTNNTTYHFSVTATNATGTRNISAVRSGKPIGSFSLASATPGDEIAQLTWGSAVGATAYTVRYGTSPGNYTNTASTSATSPYTVTGLENGVQYYFQVTATNADNGSFVSDEVSTTPFGPPTAPTGLAAVGAPGQISIGWNTVAGADSYNVYRGTSSGSYTQIATGLTSGAYVDGSVTNGTSYYYMVRAYNGFESANSAEVSLRTINSFSLTGFTPSAANQLQITWNAATGAAAYDVIYGTTSGTYTTTVSNVTSPATITGLSGGVTYYARVVARNAVGPGTQINSTNELVTTAVGPVGNPSGLAVVANPSQAVLTWTAVPGASSYIIRRGTVSGAHTDLATGVGTNSYTDTTAVNGTTYFYTVRAFNGLSSGDSNEVSIRPIASFATTSATATSSSQIDVVWPAVTGAASFDLQYGTISGSYTTTITGATSPRTITGLASNSTYYFRVVAKNAVGTGATLNATNEVSAKTATANPSGLVATATASQIQLAWANTPGAINYEVFRGTSSGSYTSLATSVGTNSYTDTTVTNGTTYYYVVRASNGTDSGNSNEASARSIASFTISSATPASSSSIQVTWPAVTGAASYDLRYGTVSGSYTTTITGATSPRTVTVLSPNTTYYFMVVAKNAVGGGASVNATAEISATTPFGAPTGLVAVGESGQNYLAWDPVAGATSYHVLRGTSTGSYTSLATGVTVANYTDTTANDGATYFYVVRANNGTDSANSNESSARPIAAFTANAPNNSTATTLDVSWNAATGAATYDIRYGTSPGTYTATLTNVTSPRTVTGLTSGQTYYFQVVAKNAIGGGATVNATNEVSGITALGAPSGVVATATTGQITLNWNAVVGATSYHVLRGTTAGSTTSLVSGITTNSYVDTTANDGTTYYYVVRSNNGVDSANSSEVSGRPISTFNITSATTNSSSQITVVFPAVAGAATYDLKYGTSAGTYSTTLAGVTSPRAVTGLSPNTTYYFMVVAKNAVGSGNSVNANAEVSATTSFGAPAGLVATATTSQISLSWTAVSGASTYHVLRGTSTGSYTSLATGVTTNAYNDTTAVNGTTYYYVVRASNGTDSANSNESSARPIAAFAQNAAASITNTSMSLSWAAATGAATYDLKYGTASGTYSTTIANATSPYTLTGLLPDTTYYFQVTAKNAIGGGATVNSNAEISATTALGAPLGFTATAGASQIALNWTAVSGASSYHILRGTAAGSHTSLVTGITGTSYTDTSVVNGTTYYYVVRANNGVDSSNSSEVSGRSIAPFTITSVTPTSSTSVDVSWPAVAGAASYDLKYGTSSGTYTTTITGATSTYSLSSLSPATTYYFMITAKNAVGSGNSVNASAEVSATTSYGAPSGLVATASTSQVQLNWSAVSGASSYHILRGTSSGSYTSLATGVSTNSYTDTTASNGTTYYYVVRANNGTDSADSNEASARPIASFTISSAAAASTTSITLTWANASGATSYDVRYGTSTGSYTTTLTGQSSPLTITGLTSGQTYYFMVSAKNTVGGGASVNATAEASAATPLSAPTGLVASATTAQIQLSWSAVAGATSYSIYRGTSSGSYTSIASGQTGTNYTDSSAANGTTYYYVVRSVKNAVESANSNEASARPIATFTIASTVANSATQITLSWNAASGAATYDVKYGTVSGTYTTTLTNQTSPLAVTGLASGTTYYFMVTAKNAIGAGASVNATAESSSTTAVGAPTGLAAVATTSQVALSWNTVAGATSYHVLRGTSSGSYTSLASGVAGVSYTDTTAANGTTYYYVVRSHNGADSVNSSEVSARPIAAFTLTSATATSATAITLSWNAAAGAASYDVKYGPSSGNYTTTLTNQTSPVSVTGLTAGQTYYFMVTAKNAVGTGASVNATNELNAATATNAPTGLVASGVSSAINLSWTSVVGATSYTVYRGTVSGTYSSLATGVVTNSYTDPTPVNGTTYYYVVRATNGTESANSNEGSARSIAAFTLIAATPASSTSVSLTWNTASGAASYDVKYGTSSGTHGTTLTGQTSPATISGLTAGQTYYFKAVAKNAVGGGASVDSTNELSAVTALNAPTGLAAVATTSQIALSWNAVSGATTYAVYRGTTSGSYTALATGLGSTSYTDTTAANGTTYYYVVRSSNGSESANSSEVSGRPISTFTISSVTATSTTAVSVTWAAATGAASYDVKYGTTSGTYGTTLTNQTSPASVTGLTAGTTYYFMVTAKNAVGSGASVNASAESTVTTPLAAPASLVAVAGSSQIALSWSAVSGATSYNVYRGTVSGTYSSLATGVGTTSYTDSTSTNGTTYFYVVRAVKSAVESANSNEATGRSIAAFTIASATASSATSVNVTWAAVTGAASYDLRWGTVSGTYTGLVTGATSPASVTGLTAGQTYYFRLVAKNAIGSGASVNSTNEPSVTLSALPTISNINDLSIESDGSTIVNFTITDSDNTLNCLTSMSKTSSNTTLVPTANIVFSGTAPNCSATITPTVASTGTSTIQLTVTDGTSSVSDSFVLTITPCVVASINWETQPVGMTAGSLFGTAPRVSLRKADNSLCQTNLEPVTIAVANDASTQQDAQITATDTVVPSGGYALFNAARMERAGTGHTLEATQGSTTSEESSTFNVTAGSASKLVWEVQPPTYDRLSILVPNPVVRVADTYGNYTNTASVSVTVALMNNNSSASFGGTKSRTTNTSGAATFNNLTVSEPQAGYYLRATATGYTAADSEPFDIFDITPQDTTAVLDLIPGNIQHPSGNVTYLRAFTRLSNVDLDGSTSWSFEVVATNPGTTSSSIRFRRGSTNIGIITVPAGVTVPTRYSVAITASSITATRSSYRMFVSGGNPTITSARIVAVQSSARRTQVQIPLFSASASSTTPYFETSSSSQVSLPDDMNSVFVWDSSKLAYVNELYFMFSPRTQTSNSACVQLFNKTTNTAIGTELCKTATSENLSGARIIIPGTTIPDGTIIEARVRSSVNGQWVRIYNISLFAQIVSIEKMQTIQRVASNMTGVTAATTNFTEHRALARSSFGSATVSNYLKCNARASVTGSSNFVLRDHNANTSGTASTSDVSGSSLSFTNQTSYTLRTAGPFSPTNGDNHFLGFDRSSGTFDIGYCFWITEASY